MSINVLPVSRILHSVSQRNRRAIGSIPVVGSSKNITDGLPTRAMAVLSLRLLPPLKRTYITELSTYLNKSTASVIPRHRICLCIKVIVAKMSGKKMTEGQITILNKILIISMDR